MRGTWFGLGDWGLALEGFGIDLEKKFWFYWKRRKNLGNFFGGRLMGWDSGF